MVNLVSNRPTRAYSRWQTGSRTAALLLVVALLVMVVAPGVQAKTKGNDLRGVIPTITSISLVNGQLIATGLVSAVINGKTYTAPFTAPVDIALDPNQTGAPAGCPILDLHLNPITVSLLGLVITTSDICLKVTAYQNGGLLGELLCSIGNLLNTNIPLSTILSGLNTQDLSTLTNVSTGLPALFNGALQHLLQAILNAVDLFSHGPTCAILHLSLGPLNLNLLGLAVTLNNCANGPVTVDITAQPAGGVLGKLLCSLANGLNPGLTLQQILNQLLALL